MQIPVYLDCHSTTPVDPQVVKAMVHCLEQNFGNASAAINRHGRAALEAVETARAQIATLAGAEPTEVIFTSGATEAINTVLRGIGRGKSWSDVHIVTCQTEHSAVLDTCQYLEHLGAKITRLPVNSAGHIDLDQLDSILRSGATLLSIMHANNETGVIHPIAEIAARCKQHNCLFHVDAAQTFGKLPITFRADQIDFLSISGHKLYAPKGIGALLIRRQTPPLRITPLIHGGGQERGIRSGTINVPGVVALGKAAELCHTQMASEQTHIARLRNLLLQLISAELPEHFINGCMEHRLHGNLNISFAGLAEPHLLLPRLQNKISVSSGSACKSGTQKPSYVLSAMGIPDDLATASLRFGISRFNTEEEIRYAARTTIETVKSL